MIFFCQYNVCVEISAPSYYKKLRVFFSFFLIQFRIFNHARPLRRTTERARRSFSSVINWLGNLGERDAFKIWFIEEATADKSWSCAIIVAYIINLLQYLREFLSILAREYGFGYFGSYECFQYART